MNIIEVPQVAGDADAFFLENCMLKRNYTSGQHNESVDGTGVDVSVAETVGAQIAKYVKKKFVTSGEKLKVIDVGTGKGHLVDQMAKHDIDSFGIEGSSNCAAHSVCDRNRLVVCDLIVPLEDERLHKAFHVSTSFELFEHIHRKHEDKFFKNLAYLSDYHLCSINVDGWPGVAYNHCNIKHPCCWLETFRHHNIKCEVMGAAPKAMPDPAWRNHAAVPTAYNKGADNEEFRDNIRFGQWDEWKFSIFCLLDLREMYGC